MRVQPGWGQSRHRGGKKLAQDAREARKFSASYRQARKKKRREVRKSRRKNR